MTATIHPVAADSPSSSAGTAPRTDTGISLADDERQRCEIWTRVMGYHRPVSSFNTGKQGEFSERRCFEEARASKS